MSDRLQAVLDACADEIARFNEAIRNGKTIQINDPDSLANGHLILKMKPDFWLVTESPSGVTASWCYANDGRWAHLLKVADVPRHPLFA